MQPDVMDMMSINNISYESLPERKTAIFLLLPDEKTIYHRLVSLFIKQSYEYIIYMSQKMSRQKIRINYVLDEFSSLPTIKDFPAMISAARSRNIRFNLFVQSKNQLILRYAEEAETIQSNCTNWIFLSSREVKFLQEISCLCGVRYTDFGSRPIMEISELQQLDKTRGQALMLIGRFKPFLGCLLDIDYYDGKQFSESCFPQREKVDRKELKFEFLKPKMNTNLTNGKENANIEDFEILKEKPISALTNEEIDKMIAKIDCKIEELEKKELEEEKTLTSSERLRTIEQKNNQEYRNFAKKIFVFMQQFKNNK